MPMASAEQHTPKKQSLSSTLVLGFVDPDSQEFVSTANIELLPASGALKITALSDIPKGSVAVFPLDQRLLQSPPGAASPKFSSFDHK